MCSLNCRVKQKPAVSVIIPVYHVEPYIEKCLNSVLSQSYTDYEAIMVNDGGSEQERNVCLSFQNRDNRFILIDMENGGLSAARNTGIDNARGDILVFLDSDDYLENDYLEKALLAFEDNDADIVQFDCYLTDANNTYRTVVKSEVEYGKRSAKEMILAVASGKMSPNIWMRVYKRELFKDICFPEGEYWEDVAVLHELLYKAQNIVYVDYAGYYYLQRNDSITKATPLNGYRWRFIQYRKRYEFVRDHYPNEAHLTVPNLMGAAIGYGKWCTLTKNQKAYVEMVSWIISEDISTNNCSLKRIIIWNTMLKWEWLFRVLVVISEKYKSVT